MKKIFLLTDYRGQFYSSTKYKGAAVDLIKLKKYFRDCGFNLIEVAYCDVDFATQNYRGSWVMYQSSEDPELKYRSYIEDIIIGLHLQGAKLVPDLYKFRAHHNKNFQEILRKLSGVTEMNNLQSRGFGTYEDYLKSFQTKRNLMWVAKASASSKSTGVHLLDNNIKAIFLPWLLSWTPSLQNTKFLFQTIRGWEWSLKISNNREKFIIQEYIAGLKGDYKIVIYGEKYYILYRNNRKNDFRASGSMDFDHNRLPPNGLLNFAKCIYESFNVPFMALDVGVKDNCSYLFEFQFLCFGQYALESSNFFYSFKENGWTKVYEEPVLEREISKSVSEYITKMGSSYS